MELIIIAGVVVIVAAILFPAFCREVIGTILFGLGAYYVLSKYGIKAVAISVVVIGFVLFFIIKFLPDRTKDTEVSL